MNGNGTVLILQIFIFLNFHITTKIRGDRDILLSLWSIVTYFPTQTFFESLPSTIESLIFSEISSIVLGW